jgi:hypothetical protein
MRVIALAAIATLGLLASHALSQSTEVGDTLLVSDGTGKVFEVDPGVTRDDVTLGGSSGNDTDLHIKDPNFSTDMDMFHFNASNGTLTLGSGTGSEAGDDGDLHILSGFGTTAITLNGSNGNVSQADTGNGFVKAWARVSPSGTLLSNHGVAGVQKEGTGTYFVNLDDEHLDRPMTATLDGHNSTPTIGFISIGLDDGFHTGTKQVLTWDHTGTLADRAFNLVVY